MISFLKSWLTLASFRCVTPALGDQFFENATSQIPADKASNLVQLDPDVKQWFQAQDEQYKTLMNLLRN